MYKKNALTKGSAATFSRFSAQNSNIFFSLSNFNCNSDLIGVKVSVTNTFKALMVACALTPIKSLDTAANMSSFADGCCFFKNGLISCNDRFVKSGQLVTISGLIGSSLISWMGLLKKVGKVFKNADSLDARVVLAACSGESSRVVLLDIFFYIMCIKKSEIK